MKKLVLLALFFPLVILHAAEFGRRIAESAEEAAAAAQKAKELRSVIVNEEGEDVVHGLLDVGAQPTALHVELLLNSNYPYAAKLRMLERLLDTHAPISITSIIMALNSKDPLSLQAFALLLQRGGKGIENKPQFIQAIYDLRNYLKWSSLTPEQKNLIVEKLKVYATLKAEEKKQLSTLVATSSSPSSFTYDLSQMHDILPEELQLEIIKNVISGHSLQEISQAAAYGSRINTTFDRLIHDPLLTNQLIESIAQGPAREFLMSLPNPLDFAQQEIASRIIAAATLHTSPALAWLRTYIVADPTHTALAEHLLVQAAATNNLVLMDSLLKSGISADAGNFIQHGYFIFESALNAAIQSRSLAGVRMLLQARANPNIQSLRFPLEEAIRVGSHGIIQELLAREANPQIPRLSSPLLAQVIARGSEADIEIIKILLNSNRIDINTISHGQTALDNALEEQATGGINPEIITLLKSRGAKTKAELDAARALQRGTKRPAS